MYLLLPFQGKERDGQDGRGLLVVSLSLSSSICTKVIEIVCHIHIIPIRVCESGGPLGVVEKWHIQF